MTSTFDKIYEIVRKIPKGKVAYYGQIAQLAGMSRGARIVGYAMSSCNDEKNVPCHRVVDKQGNTKSAFDTLSIGVQHSMLEAEGVSFLSDGRVDMEKCLWNGISEND